MSIKKNEEYQSVITGYTSDGDGVCRVGENVVFIPNTVVKDKCKFKIIKASKNVSFGRLSEIIEPSPERIDPLCPLADKCGGCQYFHMTYEEELRAKKEKVIMAFRKIAKTAIDNLEIVPADEIHSYRNKAQYPVGLSNLDTVFGFYRKNSNDIVPCERCHILPEEFDKIAKKICEMFDRMQIRPYDKEEHKGILRHIYIRNSESMSQILVTIVATRNLQKYKEQITEELIEEFPNICGIVINVNKEKGNRILGDKYFTIYGTDYLEDVLLKNKFRISPASFYQVNKKQAEKLYQCAIDFAELSKKETVVELYSGVGTITLSMAEHAKKVYGIEIVKAAVDNAVDNVNKNGIENVEFICADATQGANMLIENEVEADVVVVDPPRKGLDDTTIEAINSLKPQKVVYVSCDPATLARDIKKLSDKGFELKKYRSFDLFPRTAHVETCVLLSRKG